MQDLIPKESIVLASPEEIEDKDNVRLSLFLYQVLENVHLKNQRMQIKDPSTLKNPPLALDLYYMLTPHVSSSEQDKTEKTLEGHSVLGRAMQILHNRTLTGSSLKGNLDRNDVFHITITSLSLDDLSKIWTTFQGKPFKPSICYLVTPVAIESAIETKVQRVTERKLKKYVTG
jgi:hypothetical protein